MDKQYDLVVIGAGPGGYAAAIRAAQSGLRVAVIEADKVGGTCLNRGCIPTKTLLHSSHLYREIEHCEHLGIQVKEYSYDIRKMYQRKEEVTEKLRSGVELLLKANQVEVFSGKAMLADAHTVHVSGRESHLIKTEKILIATGSQPMLPPIEGIDLPGVLTSNELLNQEGSNYQSMVIIGGGVIGVEFATIFQALGCQVTIIEAMERLLPGTEKEISQNLNMILKKRGVKIHTSAKVVKIAADEQGLNCQFEQKGTLQQVEAAVVLVAVGRKANVEGLFADGMEPKQERGIVVDEHYETSISGVYAVGDVIAGGIQLAHVASAQACNVIDHICGRKKGIDLLSVPACLYTDPEIACVGLDSAMAKELGIEIKTGKFVMSGNGKSLIEEQERGFIKIIFDAQTEVVLGAQLMCGRATDLISELSCALVNKLTVTQLAAVIRPHPTFTEGITEAVEAAMGMAIHTMPRRN